MNKLVKKRHPKYFNSFKCIGGKCEDSCCIGWDVDIDKSTFNQYEDIKESSIKEFLKGNIILNKECEDFEIDFGKVSIKENKRCPFLDEDNYCVIHSRLGEEYLSNVCTSFPRVVNKVDNVYEVSLDVACPEAARIVLASGEKIEFEEVEGNLGKHIILNRLNTSLEELNWLPVEFFYEVRNKSIQIMQNRDLKIEDRINILGDFIKSVENEIDFNYDNASKFIKEYDINKNVGESLNITTDLIKNIIKLIDLDNITSEEFKKDTISLLNNLKSLSYLKEKISLRDNIEKYNFIFENYLVNFMYNSLFPYSEIESIYDGYIMLLVRYELIKYYLAFNYENSSKEEVIKFIQVFSKAIGHHKTYLIKVLNYIKEEYQII